MITFSRAELKNDSTLKGIFDLVKSNHKVANHTQEILYKNRHVKDFCEEATHFVMLAKSKGGDSIYFHYDVSSWYKEGQARVRIESITVYENFNEYESERLRRLHSTIHQDGISLN